jgi:hypothetical protein
LSYDLYKIIHLGGVSLLLLAAGGMLGAVITGGSLERFKKPFAMAHGLGLLGAFLGGFGMMGNAGMGFQGWILLKLLIWVYFGALLGLVRVRPEKSTLGWYVSLGLALAAVVLAVQKPF